jgi:hypothetical protein
MPIINDQLEILGAAYGLADVAARVRQAVDQSVMPNTLSIRADNGTFGDSWPWHPKTLTVVFRYGSDGAALVKAVREGETLTLGQADYDTSRAGASIRPGVAGRLTIYGASYGPADVTAALRRQIGGDQSLSYTADNAAFGDSWPGVRKTCVVVYSYQGDGPQTEIVIETGAGATMPGHDLQILGAAYGRADATAKVAAAVARQADPETLDIGADNETFGDGWPGVPKSLTVVFRYGSDGAPAVKTAREGTRLSIGADDHAASRRKPSTETCVPGYLTIWGASYGPADVTTKASSGVGSDQTLALTANNETFGDSWFGVPKACVLVSSYYPQAPSVTIVQEGGPLILQPPAL